VLQEVANIFHRKYLLDYPSIREALCECITAVGELHTNTSQTVLKACDIADRYRF
jgi:predicted nucleic acid-binding protein